VKQLEGKNFDLKEKGQRIRSKKKVLSTNKLKGEATYKYCTNLEKSVRCL